MAVNLVTASPVTGGDAANLTSPTHTWVEDTPPVPNSRQWVCSSLGGTQTGVRTHFSYSPFSVTMYKPVTVKQVGLPDPVTGVLRSVPMNEYSIVLRKGVVPLAGQAPQVMVMNLKIRVPAGSEYNDTNNVQSAFSAMIGLLKAQDNQITDVPLYASFN